MENIEKDVSEKPILRLSKTVVRRSVPMTSATCDRLRAIRDFFKDRLLEERGVEYDVPFPVCIHMLIQEYCELKNIKVESKDEERKESIN